MKISVPVKAPRDQPVSKKEVLCLWLTGIGQLLQAQLLPRMKSLDAARQCSRLADNHFTFFSPKQKQPMITVVNSITKSFLICLGNLKKITNLIKQFPPPQSIQFPKSGK